MLQLQKWGVCVAEMGVVEMWSMSYRNEGVCVSCRNP